MPKSKKPTRKPAANSAARLILPGSSPGFDPALLKRSKGARRAQRFGRGKPPRFPGRTGGR